ncbi:MAG: acyltransferase family protein [Rhizobiaceae bacterium]
MLHVANEHIPPSASDEALAKRPRLDFIEYLRAVAIVIIVVGHSHMLAWGGEYQPGRSTADALFNITTGGTALFVFITGFLLHHRLGGEMDYRRFLAGKLRHVWLPYVFITLLIALPAIIEVNLGEAEGAPDALTGVGHQLFETVALGTAGISLWYVPFAMLLFAVAPVFLVLANLERTAAVIVFGVLLVVGFHVNRPVDNASPLQSLVYFAPYFVFGILASAHYALFRSMIDRHGVVMLAGLAALLLAVAQQRHGVPGNLHGSAFTTKGIDFQFLQKFCLIVFLCGVLWRIEGIRVAILALLARYSFGIFFLHNIVIAFLLSVPGITDVSTGLPYADLMAAGAVTVALSAMLVFLVKRTAGTRSRLLIGS